jgi:hypothetical protein
LNLILGACFAQVSPDPVFNTLIRTPNGGWIAGDATYSIALPDGSTLWLFGDSFIGTALPDSSIAPGASMIRNCAIHQAGDSMQAVFQGTFENPDAFVSTLNPDSTWFWPEHGLVENDTLKIFFSEFEESSGVPGWNFAFKDTWLVKLSYPGFELLDRTLMPYHAQNEVMYGNQVLPVGDYHYIYGRRDGPNNVANAHVARVPTGNIEAPWEFFDGSGWSADPAASAWITFQAVSQQYSVTEYQGKFILLTQQIWLGTKIYTMTSGEPKGPWGNFTEIYDTPVPYATQFTYNAWAHPQFNEDGQLLVSYNSNGDFWQIFSNVELYRPTFIRVPFSMIDSTFYPSGIGDREEDHLNTVVLHQNFPNPVTGITTVQIDVSEPQMIQIQLYDIRGEIKDSWINRVLMPGHHTATMDLRHLQAGIYFYRTGNQIFKLIKINE